jgi:hypothetical protein
MAIVNGDVNIGTLAPMPIHCHDSKALENCWEENLLVASTAGI